MNTQTYINNDDKYEEIIKKRGVKQIAMFSREVLKSISNLSKGKSEEQKDKITLQIMYQNLSRINFFDRMIEYHNSVYKVFNAKEMTNPFIINKEKLDEQYICVQDNTEVEVKSKKAQLENRFAKLCRYGRNKIIEQTARGKSKEDCAKIYVNNIYKNMLISGKMEEFLDNCFKYYYKKEITKEEFNNLETTKFCNNLINTVKERYNIDVEKAYIFSLYENSHNKLMIEKSKDISKIIKIYAQEKKQGIASFCLNVKGSGNTEKQNFMDLSISIPNYANPFKLHAHKTLIQDEEKENNIEIEKQFRKYDTNIMTLPLKISTEQIEKMHNMARYNPFAFKNQKLFADERRMDITQYMINNLYQKREHQQQVILNNIKQIKQKESQLKELKKEIRQKKETARNLKEEIQSLKGNMEKSLEDN